NAGLALACPDRLDHVCPLDCPRPNTLRLICRESYGSPLARSRITPMIYVYSSYSHREIWLARRAGVSSGSRWTDPGREGPIDGSRSTRPQSAGRAACAAHGEEHLTGRAADGAQSAGNEPCAAAPPRQLR